MLYDCSAFWCQHSLTSKSFCSTQITGEDVRNGRYSSNSVLHGNLSLDVWVRNMQIHCVAVREKMLNGHVWCLAREERVKECKCQKPKRVHAGWQHEEARNLHCPALQSEPSRLVPFDLSTINKSKVWPLNCRNPCVVDFLKTFSDLYLWIILIF